MKKVKDQIWRPFESQLFTKLYGNPEDFGWRKLCYDIIQVDALCKHQLIDQLNDEKGTNNAKSKTGPR